MLLCRRTAVLLARGRGGGRGSSWRLPDVRLPGGSPRVQHHLAFIEQALQRHRGASEEGGTLHASSPAPSNTTEGRLAGLRAMNQDIRLGAAPHRQPSRHGSHRDPLLSRPLGVVGRHGNPASTWHLASSPSSRRRSSRGSGRRSSGQWNAKQFRSRYNES